MKRGYVYAGGQMVAIQDKTDLNVQQVTWVHQDPVTKSQRFTNSAGALLSQRIDLDPWGNETAKTVDPTSLQQKPVHRFTTYERDANGTDEAMHRRYNSVRSRFEQPDPSDGSYDLTNPQSFNRYAYVQNDPVNFIDPSGLTMSWNTNYIDSLGGVYYNVFGAGYDSWLGILGDDGDPGFDRGQGEFSFTRVAYRGWVPDREGILHPGYMILIFYGVTAPGGVRDFGDGLGGGGGGRDPLASGATEQPLTPDQGSLVWNALEVARSALVSDKCRRYVGEHAYNELRKLWDNYQITYFPGVQFRDDRGEVWASTRWNILGVTGVVLSYKFFSDQMVSASAAGYGITPIQRRALTLLHEARHVLCPGCEYAEDHEDWNSDIVNACFK